MRSRNVRRACGRTLALLMLVAGALSAQAAARAQPPNLLVIIADDVGTDRVAIYGDGTDSGRTPNIDRLGRDGLVFENFWAMPVCSPTRAALLTGQYPHRTGIGSAIDPDRPTPGMERGLSTDMETLPRALEPAGYTSAILGKWHLGTLAQGLDHPLRMGFAHHRGSFGNLGNRGGRPTYSRWLKVVDGVAVPSRIYATTDTVNDAIELGGQLAEPWLLIVSFNTAHHPAHVPPRDLHGYRELVDPHIQSPMAFRAMVEAMDTEIGRLLAALAPQRPVVFFLGDNGTAKSAYTKSDPRRRRAKASLYEGGVRVPLIVNHRTIVQPGRRVEGLASVTDLFATMVEIAGVDRSAEGLPPDSVSLAPYFRSAAAPSPRSWLLAERFGSNGRVPRPGSSRAVRDRRYKLIRPGGNAKYLFFDLAADPDERSPLPRATLEGAAAAAYQRLLQLLEEPPPIRGEPVSPAPAAG